MPKVMEIPVRKISGQATTLGEYKGKVVLVVNVASQCGLTPQYEGLQKIYSKYKDKGFVIAGFPANEFGAQEPGSNTEIAEFCTSKFSVDFPMFEKIVVKGSGQHPLYATLIQSQPKATMKAGGTLTEALKKHGLLSGSPSDIMWNFEKFLIDRTGRVVGRFAPDIAPEDDALTKAIESELARD